MAPVLHEEIWQQILPHLRKPTPRPTGKNPRPSIRQNDLCRVMRVSKLLNNVAAPILYTTLVTDDLPAAVYNLGQASAARGIRSKAQLLSCTRHLYLEYVSWDHARYDQLLQYGGIHFASMAMSADEMAAVCAWDADQRFGAMQLLGEAEEGSLRLKTLSIGAFLDAQVSLWRSLIWDASESGNLAESVKRAQGGLASLLGCLSPDYFCQRITFGPLALPPIVHAHDILQPQQHRAHLSLDSMDDTLPIVFAGRSRWYLEVTDADPVEEKRTAYELLRQLLARQCVNREMVATKRPDYAKLSVDIEVVGSKTLTSNKVQKRLRQDMIWAIRSKDLSPARFEADPLALRDMGSCGVQCEACGWCADDLSS